MRALRNGLHMPCFCHTRQVMCYECSNIMVWKLPLSGSIFAIKRAFPTWKHIFKVPFFPKCRCTGGLICALHSWIILYCIYSRKSQVLIPLPSPIPDIVLPSGNCFWNSELMPDLYSTTIKIFVSSEGKLRDW